MSGLMNDAWCFWDARITLATLLLLLEESEDGDPGKASKTKRDQPEW